MQIPTIDDGVKELPPEVLEGAGTASSPLWAMVCVSLVVGLVSLLELC